MATHWLLDCWYLDIFYCVCVCVFASHGWFPAFVHIYPHKQRTTGIPLISTNRWRSWRHSWWTSSFPRMGSRPTSRHGCLRPWGTNNTAQNRNNILYIGSNINCDSVQCETDSVYFTLISLEVYELWHTSYRFCVFFGGRVLISYFLCVRGATLWGLHAAISNAVS